MPSEALWSFPVLLSSWEILEKNWAQNKQRGIHRTAFYNSSHLRLKLPTSSDCTETQDCSSWEREVRNQHRVFSESRKQTSYRSDSGVHENYRDTSIKYEATGLLCMLQFVSAYVLFSWVQWLTRAANRDTTSSWRHRSVREVVQKSIHEWGDVGRGYTPMGGWKTRWNSSGQVE